MKRFAIAAAAALTMVLPIGTATAVADRDTDFANELHGFGIYGQRDFNAWMAKITCKRIDTGVDATATDSAHFLAQNLARTNSTAQVYQFLGTALRMYCPVHLDKLTVNQEQP
ncbi:DUF732 domain-containing protein [Mycolicibacterium neoaurum]|uniref:DUF732 domain-containing protein n=1 Tax=Mycolicibacterium neoaurum TaxID=1795 RepID=UPI00248AF8BA|nr:DUF732 domain-containing protein [Mycolicibacterium neoaurum]WBP95983.1 DUF732 domain-containing protein [Mycolicibacterium neoaurum]WBS09668.1 DUF732 domain-containing protein [Mycolicibacterium neoaurum]